MRSFMSDGTGHDLLSLALAEYHQAGICHLPMKFVEELNHTSYRGKFGDF